ncbi:hypothetical protein F5Y18DRAFT_439368 [Xylariaceae sp. FL1019]|nr:hypothetical protein F5Y18DRAFT_439368 [Xylariaceae sp. FL1019]
MDSVNSMYDTAAGAAVQYPPARNGAPVGYGVLSSDRASAAHELVEVTDLEPGEVSPCNVKVEEDPNSYLDYGLRLPSEDLAKASHASHDRRGIEQNVHTQSSGRLEARNQRRLAAVIGRLQNFDGSITELLAVANVQQQLEASFTELERAIAQLKDVFHHLDLDGHFSDRQGRRRDQATRDLTRVSKRIVNLTADLNKMFRRQPGKSK